MLSIIMAGGEGERLRPLTCACPKPMLTLLDKPVLAYSLILLKKHGVTSAAVTLRYLADQVVDYFGDGSEYDMSLKYYAETRPLGTAGGVKQAADFLKETFCVLSGDGVTDADLPRALEFPREKRAHATMSLKRASNPLEYGLVVTDADGHVRAFVEKPDWGGVVTDTINTGIYLMEPEALAYIPDGRPFDFGKELFPLLLKEGAPLYGYETDAYWCDVGDISAYLQVHRDALDGRISLVSMPENGILRMPGAHVDEDCALEAPCYVGGGAQIHRGAKLGAYGVLGEGAILDDYASVKRSVLYPGAYAGVGSELRGCVLARGAMLGERAAAFEGSVLGEHSRLGARAELKDGAKVWPGKRVPDGCVLTSNLVWGQRPERAFDGSLLRTATPEDATRATRALAWKLNLKDVVVGRCASAVAGAMEKAVCAGLTAQGARAYLAGECALSQLKTVMQSIHADGALYVSADGIYPVSGAMSPLSPTQKRAVDGALNRQDMPKPFTGITHPAESLGRTDLMYLGFLRSALAGSVRRLSVAVHTQRKQLAYLADQSFLRAGYAARVEWEEEMMELAPGEIGVWLIGEGERASLADEHGALDDVTAQLIMCWAMAQQGEKVIYAPADATRALDALAKSLCLRVDYAREGEHAYARALFEASPYQYHMRFDGLYAALNIISHLDDMGLTLADFRARAPEIKRATKQIPIEFVKRGEALRRFGEALPPEYERDGLFLRTEKGCAWIRPDEDKPLCQVTAESRDAEIAEELCGYLTDLLSRATE